MTKNQLIRHNVLFFLLHGMIAANVLTDERNHTVAAIAVLGFVAVGIFVNFLLDISEM